MKLELGQIIVYVNLEIISIILGYVLVITVRFSFKSMLSALIDASFSTKITSGFTCSIFYLII